MALHKDRFSIRLLSPYQAKQLIACFLVAVGFVNLLHEIEKEENGGFPPNQLQSDLACVNSSENDVLLEKEGFKPSC